MLYCSLYSRNWQFSLWRDKLNTMKILLPLLFCFSLVPLKSQDNIEWYETEVVIDSIHWVLQNNTTQNGAGFTREAALYRVFRIQEEDWFRSPRHLERRLRRGKQELETRRVFKFVDFEVVYSERDDYLEAQVYVFVNDRWNIFAFPRAAYDSNLGLLYGGRIQYKNILGTLVDMDITGYWSEEQWDITGELSNIDLFFLQGNLFYSQHYEKVYRFNNDEVLNLLYSFQESQVQFRVDVPVIPGLDYYIMPGFLTTHSFHVIDNPGGLDSRKIIEDASMYAIDITHGISLNRVSWEMNMRSGYSAVLDNRVEVALEEELPQVDLDFSINGYTHFEEIIGIAGSLSGFRVFNGIRNNAGGKLRGIQDYLVYGEWGIFINTSIDSKALSFPPVVEIHLQPFIDGAFTVSPGEKLEEIDNWFVSGGLSAVIFPLPLSSLQISVILGYNLLDPGPYELSIKTGLFF